MQLIVFDADLLCSAILFPESPARKLLVLATYGGVAQYAAGVDEEERRLLDDYAGSEGRVGAAIDMISDHTQRRRDELARRLPQGAPDDICLVGHIPIFTEVLHQVRQKGKDNVALWTGLVIAAHHRLLDASFDVVPTPPRPSLIRRTTTAGASMMKIIVGRGAVDLRHPPVYAAHERDALLLTRSPLLPRYQAAVRARHFDEFVQSPPWPASFDLRHVDGRVFDDPEVWT